MERLYLEWKNFARRKTPRNEINTKKLKTKKGQFYTIILN